jgi:hypothetical protein
VKPVLDAEFPALAYDAAFIGPGSEVLGFDTPRSMDHQWGCRVYLFLSEADHVEAADWLTFPQQRLRSIVAGGVWQNDLGELERIRAQFAYFPHDLWLYLLAAGWARIAQEDAFIGRTREVNDEAGSRIIAARLVRDLMMLAFLMERVYAPYPKWFGTAFSRLACAPTLGPVLDTVLSAASWTERESALATACEMAAERHSPLGLTRPIPTKVSLYYDRPFQVIRGNLIADALVEVIRAPEVRRIAEKTRIGSVDQFSDSTDLREDLRLRRALKGLYRAH